jgi:hypothetical protein
MVLCLKLSTEFKSIISFLALIRVIPLTLGDETFHQELVTYDFPLVDLHIISIISLWCMLGGNGWIWTKSNLFRYIEDQTRFSTFWHAKMSLTLDELMWNVLCSNLHITSPSMRFLVMEGVVCKMTNSRPKTHGEFCGGHTRSETPACSNGGRWAQRKQILVLTCA